MAAKAAGDQEPISEHVCMAHSGFASRVRSLETSRVEAMDDRQRMWVSIDAIRNRLPAWAVAVIALLSGFLGAVVKTIAS